jgi:hypothetical protein
VTDEFHDIARSNRSTPRSTRQEAQMPSSSFATGLAPSGLRHVDGRVIRPDDAGYDEARAIFYTGPECRPALIVKAANAVDVARVVALARDSGLELAVRSGGHSGAGHARPVLGDPKRRYDPTNLFRRNQNIAPADGAPA